MAIFRVRATLVDTPEVFQIIVHQQLAFNQEVVLAEATVSGCQTDLNFSSVASAYVVPASGSCLIADEQDLRELSRALADDAPFGGQYKRPSRWMRWFRDYFDL